MASAVVLRAESLAYLHVGLFPAWRHWLLLVCLIARTFLLVSELADLHEPRPEERRRPIDFALFLLHLLTFAGAVLWGQSSLALMSLGLWLGLTTPAGAWRSRFKSLVASHGAALVAGVAIATAVPAERELWSGSEEGQGTALSQWTLAAVHWVLLRIDSTSSWEPENLRLTLRGFRIRVMPGCAGVEGMALVFLFVAAYLLAFRRSLRFPRALMLLPLGLVLSFGLNIVRLTSLVLIGAAGWPDIAVAGFHSRAGWLAFSGIAVGLAALGRTPVLAVREEAEETQVRSAAAPYLMPMLAFLAASLVSEAASAGFNRFYGLHVGAVALVVWWYRDDYRVLPWRVSPQAMALGALVFAFWMLLPRSPDDRSVSEGLARLTSLEAGTWVALRIMGSALVAPLAEELAFRGWLSRQLQKWNFESVPLGQFTLVSMLGSSLAFGLLHGRWFAGTLAGVVYALALRRRGSIGDAVVAHATTNTLLCVWAVLFHDWSVM